MRPVIWLGEPGRMLAIYDGLAQGIGLRFDVFEAFKVGVLEGLFGLFGIGGDERDGLEGTPREGTRPTAIREKVESAGFRRIANGRWQMAERRMVEVHNGSCEL